MIVSKQIQPLVNLFSTLRIAVHSGWSVVVIGRFPGVLHAHNRSWTDHGHSSALKIAVQRVIFERVKFEPEADFKPRPLVLFWSALSRLCIAKQTAIGCGSGVESPDSFTLASPALSFQLCPSDCSPT